MDNIKHDDFDDICGCPFHKSCHNLRQTIHKMFNDDNENDEDCDFYIALKPMYERQGK